MIRLRIAIAAKTGDNSSNAVPDTSTSKARLSGQVASGMPSAAIGRVDAIDLIICRARSRKSQRDGDV